MNLLCKSILKAALVGIIVHIALFLLFFFTLYYDTELLLRFLSSLIVPFPLAVVLGMLYFFCASPHEVIHGDTSSNSTLHNFATDNQSFSPVPSAPPENFV